MSSLKYVFPCTGRSGSKYVSELMTACGMNCGHESVYHVSNKVEDGIPLDEWRLDTDPEECAKGFEAESSFVLAPFLNHPVCRDARVVHIVRNPLHVIDSWRHQTHFGSFPFMSTFCPVDSTDIVSFMAGLWVSWNKYIEAQNWGTHPAWDRCQVENTDQLLKLVGLKPAADMPEKTTNSIGSKRITRLSDIEDWHMRQALRDLAKEYGYELR